MPLPLHLSSSAATVVQFALDWVGLVYRVSAARLVDGVPDCGACDGELLDTELATEAAGMALELTGQGDALVRAVCGRSVCDGAIHACAFLVRTLQ